MTWNTWAHIERIKRELEKADSSPSPVEGTSEFHVQRAQAEALLTIALALVDIRSRLDTAYADAEIIRAENGMPTEDERQEGDPPNGPRPLYPVPSPGDAS